MDWTYKENFDLIENLRIVSCINDGKLVHYRIYPAEGYVLWIPTLDEYEYDDEGNLLLDENGESVLLRHYYTQGGATALPTYDFAANPNEYQAVLNEKG